VASIQTARPPLSLKNSSRAEYVPAIRTVPPGADPGMLLYAVEGSCCTAIRQPAVAARRRSHPGGAESGNTRSSAPPVPSASNNGVLAARRGEPARLVWIDGPAGRRASVAPAAGFERAALLPTPEDSSSAVPARVPPEGAVDR
jgi:hypothetical protein